MDQLDIQKQCEKTININIKKNIKTNKRYELSRILTCRSSPNTTKFS